MHLTPYVTPYLGVYRAPRHDGFWLRDFWSALEDYERRLLPAATALYGGPSHLVFMEGVALTDDGTGVVFVGWGS